ncbi:MAG: zinc-binding dehydrogenase [Planctomycetes bacterium]|nr:zinc-binding dehydrogenase [Planctomycetota bacterium]
MNSIFAVICPSGRRIVGAGFMGLASLSALAGGWQTQILSVEPDPARRAMAIELGATHAIDSSAGDAVEQTRSLTDGRGADVSIDFVGNVPATTLAARLLRTRGRLVAAAGFLPQDHNMEIYLSAITIHHTPPAFSREPHEDWRRTIDAMARGRYPVQRLISHRFGLSRIQEAFETAMEGARLGYVKGIVVNDL